MVGVCVVEKCRAVHGHILAMRQAQQAGAVGIARRIIQRAAPQRAVLQRRISGIVLAGTVPIG